MKKRRRPALGGVRGAGVYTSQKLRRGKKVLEEKEKKKECGKKEKETRKLRAQEERWQCQSSGRKTKDVRTKARKRGKMRSVERFSGNPPRS